MQLVSGLTRPHSIDQAISIEASEDGQNIHYVRVGSGGKLTFEPNRLNANIGDQVIFEFSGLNHTLTQSSLGRPCTPAGQLDSGFNQFNPTSRTGLTLTITVNSLEPQWFFCRQIDPTSHCHAGMVFGLNPGDHMDEFLANVRRAQSTSTTARNVIATTTPAIATTSVIITAPTALTTSPTAMTTTRSSYCQAGTNFVTTTVFATATIFPTTTEVSTATVFLTASTKDPTDTTEVGTTVQSATQTNFPRSLSSITGTASRCTGVYFGLFIVLATSVLLL